MITTRESIKYQFSLIFGYSSPNDIVVGDIVGPGNLAKKKVNQLSKSVISQLRMFNAILRDYTGSELYSVEFELYNYDSKEASIKINPKSMIMVPGKYKDCESLLLALKPETGYLDVHKPRTKVDGLSKLFFEVEEFSNHPDLSKDERKLILQEFASRFSLILFGELYEDKWNKKLIGINVSIPTEKEMLESYGSIVFDVEIDWNKHPIQIRFENPKFQSIKASLPERAMIDHLAYTISEPSAKYVVDKSLELGNNLLELANLGTIDESKERIIVFIFHQFEKKFDEISERKNIEWIISSILNYLDGLDEYFSQFLERSRQFIYSGQSGNMERVINSYRAFLSDKFENNLDGELIETLTDFIKENIQNQDFLRTSDLDSSFNYFSEMTNSSTNLIRKMIPIYFSRLRFRNLCSKLIENLIEKLDHETKPVMELGKRILSDLQNYLFNLFELSPLLSKKVVEYDDNEIMKEFKRIVTNNLSNFFKDINLNISDLVAFAEIQMESSYDLIKEHINKFKTFSVELSYLLSYILRYSTINRFLKENLENEINDPVTFSNKFHRFLEKRIGGIQLNWKHFVLDWIKDYAKKFFKIEEQKEWKLNEIYYDFIVYLEKRYVKEEQIYSFIHFLDNYIGKNATESNKKIFLEFYRKYEHCIGISTEFPSYIKKMVEVELNLITFPEENFVPRELFMINKEENLFSYLREKSLKYFSKLIPRPVSIILKHNSPESKRKLFKNDLFYVLNFKYWGTKCSVEVSDNFKEVYREWLREK